MGQTLRFQRKFFPCVIFGLFFTLFEHPSVLYGQDKDSLLLQMFFNEEMEEDIAIGYVDSLRKGKPETKKSEGTVYDPDSIINYINQKMPKIIYRMTNSGRMKIPPEYAWKIGFYWMLTRDKNSGNKRRRSFCVVPTLVDTTKRPWEVIDYFNDKHKPERDRKYKHPKTGAPATPLGFKGNAYDAGHLYP